MYDVVIIGGGPVGSFAANLIAAKGLSCAVVEEHASPNHMVICTGILGIRAFSEFRLPRSGVLTELRSAKFISPSGMTLSVRSKDAEACVLDRGAFNRDLYRLAAAKGVHFFFGFRASRIKVHWSRVTIEADSDVGGRIDAAVAVVSTGVHYQLFNQLGLERPQSFIEAAQVEAEMEGVEEVEVYFGQQWAPGSFAWVVPLPDEKARIGLHTQNRAAAYLEEFLRSPFIAPRLKGTRRPLRARLIPLEALSRTYLDRTLIAGDAAGQVKPTTGGGLYYGFIGAAAAAETIAQAFSRGDFSSAFLRRYEQRWKERIGLEMRVGKYFRRLASTLGDAQIDYLLKACRQDGLGEIIRRTSDFDSHRRLILHLLRHPLFWNTLKGLSIPPTI